MSRKFRWTFEATFPTGKIEPQFVRVSARPESPVFHPDNVKENVPHFFKTTYYSQNMKEGEVSPLADLYKIMNGFFQADDDNVLAGDALEAKKGTGILKLMCPRYVYKPSELTSKASTITPIGLGLLGQREFYGWDTIDEWEFTGLRPTEINFGELGYSSSDEIDIEVTWCYDGHAYRNNFTKTS